jgi:predicted DNA-binding transcriptional regulator AlpA
MPVRNSRNACDVRCHNDQIIRITCEYTSPRGEPNVLPNPREYLTGPQVDHRYGVSSMTRWRWLNDPELGFPQPLRIRGRLFFSLTEIEDWERLMAARRVAA